MLFFTLVSIWLHSLQTLLLQLSEYEYKMRCVYMFIENADECLLGP